MSVSKQLLTTRVRHGIIGSFGFDRHGDITSGAITVYRVLAGPPVAGLLDHKRAAGYGTRLR